MIKCDICKRKLNTCDLATVERPHLTYHTGSPLKKVVDDFCWDCYKAWEKEYDALQKEIGREAEKQMDKRVEMLAKDFVKRINNHICKHCGKPMRG